MQRLATCDEAYPGIGTRDGAVFNSLVVQRIVDVSWQSPGSPDPAGMLFATSLSGEDLFAEYGFEEGPSNDDIFQPRMFLNVFPYDGATDGAFDAEFECDDGTMIGPENALIIRRWLGETEHVFELLMGDHIDVLMKDLEREYERSGPPAVLSQENFVFPRENVIDVVGTVSEMPSLPERPETSLCGAG